ncbi:hypothetical protein [Vibrio owensii]|uniref:hypothetical protein n=1 Tax=Vibrio harveyi group TaxID=717610 RepID=UPI003CC59F46
MKFEHIIQREDGSQVCIALRVSVTHDGISVNKIVETKGKGKRKFRPVIDTNNYTYRQLSRAERLEYIEAAQLEVVTKQEIEEAKKALSVKLAELAIASNPFASML